MELFERSHGLLFTMTTITPSFFAPKRNIEHHAVNQKSAWRSLFASACFHGLGVMLVIGFSQLPINSQQGAKKPPLPSTEIAARLYYLPSPQSAIRSEEKTEAPIVINETTSVSETVKQQNTDITSDIAVTPNNSKEEDAPKHKDNEQSKPSAPLSIDANRRSGSLNLSAKDGAAQYFNKYNNSKIIEDAEQAARAFQQRKTSPVLNGPSTQQIQAKNNQRPSIKVNCSSTKNKIMASLSGITGGTLECTKMDNHNRFIDARINKLPKEPEDN